MSTVSIKFKTKEDIVDTLNKDSFKSKSHARQSQIINLIHQRVRAAYSKASGSIFIGASAGATSVNLDTTIAIGLGAGAEDC